MPRVGVLSPEVSEYPDLVQEAGGEPVPLGLPLIRPAGVALHREWAADWAQISCSGEDLDGLLISAVEPAELAGSLIAALRLGLPAILAAPLANPITIALAALGFASFTEDPARVAVWLSGSGSPSSRELVEGFSLANALRTGLAAGAGPELLVHLAALAREAGAVGFPRMIRVLAPESPQIVDLGDGGFATSFHTGPGVRDGGRLSNGRVGGRVIRRLPLLRLRGSSHPGDSERYSWSLGPACRGRV